MTVISHHELPRSGLIKLGGIPELSRRFVCVVDDPATTTFAECQTAVGVQVGSGHPEYSGVKCLEVQFNEALDGNRYHVEVICQYGSAISQPEAEPEVDPEFDVNPLLRPDIWTFESGGVAVPALSYYQDSGARAPLTNSAFDYFEGLTVDEAQTKVTVTGNRAQFPAALAIAITNVINSAPWLGAPSLSWKCQGISATLKYEEITVPDETAEGGVSRRVVRFWEISSTLLYRQGGWNLQLPDVGFNYLSGGQKRRVMTFDFENAEWIPSPVPMGLDGAGNQTFGAPAILNRRIYRVADFNQYFSTPPPFSTT